MIDNIHFSMQDVGNHQCPIHQFDTPPKIDFHLWSIDQAIFLIKDRAANKCHFTVTILVLIRSCIQG